MKPYGCLQHFLLLFSLFKSTNVVHIGSLSPVSCSHFFAKISCYSQQSWLTSILISNKSATNSMNYEHSSVANFINSKLIVRISWYCKRLNFPEEHDFSSTLKSLCTTEELFNSIHQCTLASGQTMIKDH